MADSKMYYGTVPFLPDAPLTEEQLVSRFKCEPWIAFGRMAMSDPRIMHCFVERTRPQRVFCIEGNWYLGLTDEDRPAVIMDFDPEPVRDEVAVLRGLTPRQASAGRTISLVDLVSRQTEDTFQMCGDDFPPGDSRLVRMIISMIHNPPRLGLADHPIGIHMTRQTHPKYLVVDGMVRIMAYLALYGDLLGPAESVKFSFTRYAGTPTREGNYRLPLFREVQLDNLYHLRFVRDDDYIHPNPDPMGWERFLVNDQVEEFSLNELSVQYPVEEFNIGDWE